MNTAAQKGLAPIAAIIVALLVWVLSNAAFAAAPAFQAAGTVSAGTGARTVTWPTHAVGDIALLLVQTANQSVTLTTPAGFVEVTNSPQGTGTAGSTVATRLAVYWARATSTSMTSPVVGDSGNNQVTQIITFRNVIATGNPWDTTAGGVLGTASASFTIPGATTTVDNDLVVAIVANGYDSSTGQVSSWTNASLTSLTERTNANNSAGNGGGFGVVTGVKATAGAYSATTGTLAHSSVQALLSIALKPLAVSAANSTVAASPTSIAADNTTTSTVTVTLKDSVSSAVSGKTVTLAAGSGSSTITTVSGTTNSSGAATFTVKDGTAEGPITYTATDTSDAITVTQTAAVTFSRLTAPTVTQTFSAATIAANGASTLTITITNPNPTAINGLAFTDTYPSTNLKNATTPALTNSCGGTATATAGTSTLSLSGGTLAGSSSCTVSVSVTSAVAGSYTNPVLSVTSTNATSGSAATATLTVTAISAANSTVLATSASVAADGTSTSTVTVTLKDGASNGVSGKTVTLAAGSGSSTITTVSGTTNSSGAATFTVKDGTAEGPITYTATDTSDAITVTQTAAVTFSRLTAPTVTQTFSAATIAANGASTLTITITNPNATAINGLAFTDTYPSTNLKNATTPALTNSCGGTATATAGASTLSLSGGTLAGSSSCTVSVSVTAPAASYANSTGTITSSNATNGTAATATLTVTAISAANSTVTASPLSISADNSTTSTITVTLKDGASTGVSGKTVTLAKSGGNSTITTVTGTTNASGVATFTVKDGTVEGPITYTATDTTDAITVTQTAQVTFVVAGSLNCTSNASGNWTLPATWTNCRSGIPLVNDQVTILSAHTVTLNTTTPVLGNLTNGGTLTASGTNTLSIGGNLINNGTMSLGSSNIDLYGDFSNNTGTSFNPGASDSGTWTFRGATVQNINSTGILTTFPNLTLNNSLGIALNASATVKTLLALTNGYISTGTNILILSANCNTPSWSRGNGFVAGNLRLTFPSASSPGVSCTYPIGSGTNYAPLGLTLVSAGGSLTGSTSGNEHPAIASSTIDPTLDANRYWTLGHSSDTPFTVTSYGATFNFQTGDLDINPLPASFIVAKYASGTWTLPATVSGASSASISSVSGPITIPTDFAIGQIPVPCTVPSDLPDNMTCVCDNFGRANLNPSTIYGADWLVSNKNQASTFGNPRIVNSGKLQLTDNSGGVATVANVPSTFPAAGNLIVVEFKHYAYNGSGADGIALTLSDATLTPTPGAFGGSLGYAQKSNPGSDCATSGGCPGFNGGWVGIAIDEWGNFSANTEGRTGGTSVPGQTPDSVAVRGSGSGQTGYPYLGGSATLSTPGIDNAGSATAAYGHLYKVTVDARCYQSNTTGCSNPSLNKVTTVKVERDTTGLGTGYANVVPAFDAFVVNASQAAVPTNWKLSFTGSTGGANNFHEIAGLKICAQTITPPAGYRIQVDNLSPNSCTTAANGKPIVTVTALDNGGSTLTTYTSPVSLSARIGSSAGSVSTTATWTPLVSNQGTWDAVNKRYTFAANDLGVAKFQLTDSATENIYIVVSEFITGSTLSSSLITPVQFSGGTFSISTPDTLGTGVVAGRPHLMRVTRTTGCSTDTGYSGSKALDGWFTPDHDHPANATYPYICAANGAGTCQPAGGSCVWQPIAPPQPSSGSNNLTLAFVNGVTNFCLVTSDVGKYAIGIRDDSNEAAPITGLSAALTARPLALYFNTATQGSLANPKATTASGTKFIIAGDTFEGNVSALLWNAALDPGYTGTPTVTPQTNAADWTSALSYLTPSFAWPTALSVASVVSPSGGSGTLSGASTSLAASAYAGGQAVLPANSLSIDNIGSFLLTEAVAATPGYINTSGTTVPAYSDVIGRFYLDHFSVSGIVTAACNGFTYMGQPNLGIALTVTAQNKTGGTASNYTTATAPTLVAEDQGSGNTSYNLGSRISGLETLSWSAGIGTVSSSTTFSRPTVLGLITGTLADAAGPFTQLQIGVQLSDADGAAIQGLDMRATTTGDCTAAANCDAKAIGSTTGMRFGSLKIDNASGSERQNLPVKVSAMYYAGNPTGWAVNTLDGCTALPVAPFTPLAADTTADACYTAACTSNTGGGVKSVWLHDVGGTAIAKAAQPNASSAATLTAGTGTITLAAPSDPGTLELSLVAPAWLRTNSGTLAGAACTSAVFGCDPKGRITFGVYGPKTNKSKFIYIRENY